VRFGLSKDEEHGVGNHHNDGVLERLPLHKIKQEERLLQRIQSKKFKNKQYVYQFKHSVF